MSTSTERQCDEQHNGIAIICLGREYGSADFRLLAALEGRLLAEIDASPTGLVIDLGATTYIGCGLVSVLLRCSARARSRNRRFALCAIQPVPKSVLAIAGVNSLWETFRTRQEAIASMQRPQPISFPGSDSGSYRSGDVIPDGV